jgi:hypothetical protein
LQENLKKKSYKLREMTMSKKSNKTNQVRKPVKTAPRTTAKTAGGRPVNGKPTVVKGRVPVRVAEPPVNLQAVRIVAAVVAGLCLVGAIVAIALGNVHADVASIIEMVLLALIIAFGIFTAVKPGMVSGWVSRLGK